MILPPEPARSAEGGIAGSCHAIRARFSFRKKQAQAQLKLSEDEAAILAYQELLDEKVRNGQDLSDLLTPKLSKDEMALAFIAMKRLSEKHLPFAKDRDLTSQSQWLAKRLSDRPTPEEVLYLFESRKGLQTPDAPLEGWNPKKTAHLAALSRAQKDLANLGFQKSIANLLGVENKPGAQQALLQRLQVTRSQRLLGRVTNLKRTIGFWLGIDVPDAEVLKIAMDAETAPPKATAEAVDALAEKYARLGQVRAWKRIGGKALAAAAAGMLIHELTRTIQKLTSPDPVSKDYDREPPRDPASHAELSPEDRALQTISPEEIQSIYENEVQRQANALYQMNRSFGSNVSNWSNHSNPEAKELGQQFKERIKEIKELSQSDPALFKARYGSQGP